MTGLSPLRYKRAMAPNTIRGMLPADELKKLVDTGEIETVLAVFPDLYGRLVGKRIIGPFFCDEILGHGMHACDYLLSCDMEMDPVPGYKFTSWSKGYGDFRCLPDLSTLRRATWLDRTALVLCDVYEEEEEEEEDELQVSTGRRDDLTDSPPLVPVVPAFRLLSPYENAQRTHGWGRESRILGAVLRCRRLVNPDSCSVAQSD